MYFLFLLILFGIAYIVYASKVSSDERLEELRNKKENLKREKEKCEAELKDLKEMKSKVSKANYEQRQYNNLDFLYANNNIEGDN